MLAWTQNQYVDCRITLYLSIYFCILHKSKIQLTGEEMLSDTDFHCQDADGPSDAGWDEQWQFRQLIFETQGKLSCPTSPKHDRE